MSSYVWQEVHKCVSCEGSYGQGDEKLQQLIVEEFVYDGKNGSCEQSHGADDGHRQTRIQPDYNRHRHTRARGRPQRDTDEDTRRYAFAKSSVTPPLSDSKANFLPMPFVGI